MTHVGINQLMEIGLGELCYHCENWLMLPRHAFQRKKHLLKKRYHHYVWVQSVVAL
jgi:hypothetical protein